MIAVRLLDPARVELTEAVAWYDSQRMGLGDEFLAEFERALGRIREYPHAWQALSERVRRCRLNRFPYGLVYEARGDELIIVAVMHNRRRPRYWRGRLSH